MKRIPKTMDPRTALLAVVACGVLALAAGESRASQLVQTFDRIHGIVRVHVESDSRGTLAEYSRAASQPPACGSGYRLVAADAVARLRDQLDEEAARGDEEAGSAAIWMRQLLADNANASADELREDLVVMLPQGVTTSWCGLRLDIHRECPSDCIPTSNPRDCAGCGCTATSSTDPVKPPTIDPKKP